DCTVAIGDVLFKAHKAVLAAFSNYFRMLFIHQNSDCVRLKPSDIQADIFSYLLNLMYTGKFTSQPIDPLRLEQGVKFLHAYPLLQEASLLINPESQYVPLTNSLYGIQIPDKTYSRALRWVVKLNAENLNVQPVLASLFRRATGVSTCTFTLESHISAVLAERTSAEPIKLLDTFV
uniref:Zinc finger and BTB domain containing 2a n=1 Tax=Cyprinus carpio TaxID=7962 RepID=A0A8C2FKP5_CYPCA